VSRLAPVQNVGHVDRDGLSCSQHLDICTKPSPSRLNNALLGSSTARRRVGSAEVNTMEQFRSHGDGVRDGRADATTPTVSKLMDDLLLDVALITLQSSDGRRASPRTCRRGDRRSQPASPNAATLLGNVDQGFVHVPCFQHDDARRSAVPDPPYGQWMLTPAAAYSNTMMLISRAAMRTGATKSGYALAPLTMYSIRLHIRSTAQKSPRLSVPLPAYLRPAAVR
jgi:hypothetical protein